MKRFLWLAITGLLLLNLYVLWYHWKFEETPPDEELRQTPKAPGELSVAALPIRETPDLERLKNTNLFDPERGRGRVAESAAPTSAPRPDFELIGICLVGDSAGAIIDKKNVAAGDPKKIRRYYALGSDVGGGFLLDTVLETTVILRRDGEILELTVGRSRFGEQAKGYASLERTGNIALEANKEIVVSEVPVADAVTSPDNNGGAQ